MLGQHSSIPTQSTGPVNGQTTPTAQSNLPGKLPSNLLFRVNAVLLMVTSRGAFVSSDLAGALKFVTSDLNSHEGKTGVVSFPLDRSSLAFSPIEHFLSIIIIRIDSGNSPFRFARLYRDSSRGRMSILNYK
ncbi:hypothetical protein PCASD_14410 [Puccinia coronata f. sp. avenae]|uniref:Uncharacterized protein n=1 Tax=Puccinia coronata f. sp. avenae TaxID=200324 RepID=A0A2N5U6X5_9BASI|nr:hypothetical protein PCASD_14410 [Puccinia coronata f. sp. avenae]